MKTITVFGSSQVRPDQPLYDTAVEIGAGLARAGYKVMTGGYYGMMEAVSKGARQADGHVIGVTTDQIGKRFNVEPNAYNCEIVHFADLRDRLLYMVEQADAYLAMPGGTGTLHEIAETWELMRIGGIPDRPFICFGGLWQGIIAALQASPYLGAGYQGMITIARTREEVFLHLNGADGDRRE
ncbi:MAG: LOG family protein [Chloroflexota bacterium]|nr:LOG family protein [Chloroflexota bacterium]